MIEATLERPMADKKPATLSVKLHMDVIESARIVAALRGITMTDLISDMVRDELARMESEEIAKRSKAPKGKKP